MTGIVSRIIHSGLFGGSALLLPPDLRNAETTFRRLIARCCFWPLDVAICSRRSWARSSRFSSCSRSRMACAPMPSPRYSPKPYSEAKRSLSSRASFSSGTTCLGAIPLNSSHARSSSSTRSSWSSWTSFLRCSMSSTISRTLSAQASICRCSSRDILPSPLRHRSLARPRRSLSSSPRCSAPSRTTSASRPLPSERALSNSLAARSPARAVLRSPSSSAPSSPARNLMALSKRVRARPFSAPLPPSTESSVAESAFSASPATAATSSRSFGPEPAVVADRQVVHELADLLGVRRLDLRGDLAQQAVGHVAGGDRGRSPRSPPTG